MTIKKIALIGLGYVGLPLAVHFGEKTKFNFFNVALNPNICLKFLNKKILTCERDNVLYG